jgi:DnaK suppressor protein
VEPDPPFGRAEPDGQAEPDGTEMTPVDVDLALDAIEQELADVELALERLGEGSYGRCETCGQVLSDEELESAPANRFCRDHLPLHLA